MKMVSVPWKPMRVEEQIRPALFVSPRRLKEQGSQLPPSVETGFILSPIESVFCIWDLIMVEEDR
jgi:hypothetical protein